MATSCKQNPSATDRHPDPHQRPSTIPDTPRCYTCGKVPPKTLDQTWQQWEAMRYCDTACRKFEINELIAEVEFIIGTDHPENIAQRLGYKPASLSRRLSRAGRADLAAPFTRVDTYQRHGWGSGS
jgi:hypothetical protein